MVSFESSFTKSKNPAMLCFGIVADVHKDLVPDANERLEKFIDEAINRNVDFIIQLGDFCTADRENRDFLVIWETFKGPKYHVLGNHDLYKNTKQQIIDFWGMPKTYYSFDFNDIHFIILDANFLFLEGRFVDYQMGNFYVHRKHRNFIDDKQIEWFDTDLDNATLPTIVFSHQSLWHYQFGINNRLTLQKTLEAHSQKIICCMNGHNHIDFHHNQNGIDYIEVNSLSFQWMDDKYHSTQRYSKDFYQQYKTLHKIAPYKDPLYAFATVTPTGCMTIEGVRSQWISPSPYDMGMHRGIYGDEYSAEISDYNLKFKGEGN